MYFRKSKVLFSLPYMCPIFPPKQPLYPRVFHVYALYQPDDRIHQYIASLKIEL